MGVTVCLESFVHDGRIVVEQQRSDLKLQAELVHINRVGASDEPCGVSLGAEDAGV
jgi:hypothetical protein